jgi:hypothetical protein
MDVDREGAPELATVWEPSSLIERTTGFKRRWLWANLGLLTRKATRVASGLFQVRKSVHPVHGEAATVRSLLLAVTPHEQATEGRYAKVKVLFWNAPIGRRASAPVTLRPGIVTEAGPAAVRSGGSARERHGAVSHESLRPRLVSTSSITGRRICTAAQVATEWASADITSILSVGEPFLSSPQGREGTEKGSRQHPRPGHTLQAGFDQ